MSGGQGRRLKARALHQCYGMKAKAVAYLQKSQSPAITLELGQRMMLRCALGYLVAAALSAAIGFAAVGRIDLGAIVFILLFSALLLGAGLLCGALGAFCVERGRSNR